MRKLPDQKLGQLAFNDREHGTEKASKNMAWKGIQIAYGLLLVLEHNTQTLISRAKKKQTMAMRACLLLIAVLAASLTAHAADPDITSDFITPPGVTPDGGFFTFTGLRNAITGGPKDAPFKATKASQAEFPALAGQSVSLAVLQYEPSSSGINPPHIHPRSAELFLVLDGVINVGLVDSGNNFYNQTLYAGDAFIFPKGLVHYQVNGDSKYIAVAVSAFGSANAGTISLPKNLFGSGILNWVLAQSFKTDVGTIGDLVSANTN